MALKEIAAVVVSSSVVSDVVVEIVGTSLTAAMATLTVFVTVTAWSLTVMIKLSDPFALVSGV